jgi:hypothetical protein
MKKGFKRSNYETQKSLVRRRHLREAKTLAELKSR